MAKVKKGIVHPSGPVARKKLMHLCPAAHHAAAHGYKRIGGDGKGLGRGGGYSCGDIAGAGAEERYTHSTTWDGGVSR